MTTTTKQDLLRGLEAIEQIQKQRAKMDALMEEMEARIEWMKAVCMDAIAAKEKAEAALGEMRALAEQYRDESDRMSIEYMKLHKLWTHEKAGRKEAEAKKQAREEEVRAALRLTRAKASDADLVKTFGEFDDALKKDPAQHIEEIAKGVLAEAAIAGRNLGKMGPWQLKKLYDGWIALGKPDAAQYAEIHRKLGRRPDKSAAQRYLREARKHA
jgi:hypothetical protein